MSVVVAKSAFSDIMSELRSGPNTSGDFSDVVGEMRAEVEKRIPFRATNITNQQISDLRARLPDLTGGMNRAQMAEMTAITLNNPGGQIGARKETFFESIARAPGRFTGSAIEAGFIRARKNTTDAIAAMADVVGLENVAEVLRVGGDILVKDYAVTKLGMMAREESKAGTFGGIVGGIAPSIVSLAVRGTATPFVLAYYGLQAVGGGSEEYRQAMLAQGIEPDAIEALAIGVGFGVVEIVAEKIGLDLIGKKVGPALAKSLGDAILRGKPKQVARILLQAEIISDIEGVEEVLTELAQNAIASKGLPGITPGFDPDRDLSDNLITTFIHGKIGGALLTVPAVFSARGRAALAGEDIQGPLSPEEADLVEAIEQASPEERQEALEAIQKLEESGGLSDQQKEMLGSMRERVEAERRPVSELEEGIVQERLETLPTLPFTELQELARSRGIDPNQTREALIIAMGAEEQLKAHEEEERRVLGVAGERAVPPSKAVTEEITKPAKPPEAVEPSRVVSKARSVKARIREVVIGSQAERRITERDALKANLKAQVKAARTADVAARRKAASETRLQLQELRQQGQARERNIDSLKGELIKVINKQFGKDVPKALLNEVGRIKTFEGMFRGLRKVRLAIAEQERTEAAKSLKKTLKSVKADELRPQFKEAVNKLIANVGVLGLSKSKANALNGLKDYLDRVPEATVPRSASEELNRLAKTPVDKLTTEEATDIDDAINSIIKQNQLFNRLKKTQRDREFKADVDLVHDEIEANVTERKIQVGGRIKPVSRGGLANIPFGWVENMIPDTLSEYLSGSDQSRTSKILYGDVRDAQSETMGGWLEESDALEEIVNTAGIESGSEQLSQMSPAFARRKNLAGQIARMFNQEHLLDTTATVHEIKLESGETLPLFEAQRMHLLALVMDQETHDMLVFKGVQIHRKGDPAGKNFTLTQQDIQTIRDNASPAELEIVERIVNERINGTLKETTQAWSLDHNGFDITNPNTHFPRKIVREGEAVGITGRQFIQGTLESASIVQPRNPGNNPIEIDDFFVVVNNFAWSTHAVANLGPAIEKASRLLNAKPIKEILANSKQSRAAKRFEDVYDLMASETVGGPTLSGPMSDAARGVINNLGVGLLGFNPGVAMKQVASVAVAANEMPVSHLARALAEGSFLDGRLDTEMEKASPRIRFRMRGNAAALVNEGSLGGRNILGFRGRGDIAMGLIRFFDRMVIRTIWKGAKFQAANEGFTGQEATNRAAEITERVINRTQPTFDALHLSGIGVEARKNVGVKLFTFFRAQRGKNVDMQARSAIRIKRDPSSRLRESAKLANVFILNSIIIVAMTELKRGLLNGFQGDEEEEDLKRWAGKAIEVALGNFILGEFLAVVLKQVVVPGERAFDPDLSPLISVAVDGLHGFSKVVKGVRDDGDAVKILDGASDIVSSIAALKGVPVLVSPVKDAKRALKNAFEESGGRVNRFVP